MCHFGEHLVLVVPVQKHRRQRSPAKRYFEFEIVPYGHLCKRGIVASGIRDYETRKFGRIECHNFRPKSVFIGREVPVYEF